jgi:hypothetical protein
MKLTAAEQIRIFTRRKNTAAAAAANDFDSALEATHKNNPTQRSRSVPMV